MVRAVYPVIESHYYAGIHMTLQIQTLALAYSAENA